MHDVATMVDAAVNRAALTANAATTPTAEPLQVAPVVRKLFMLLHGSYGSLFLAKFSTGEKDAQGRDKGIRAAMKVWESQLSRYPSDVIETAAQRLTTEHPDYPPHLPQFETLCLAVMPRRTYAQETGLPRLAAPAQRPPTIVSFELRGDGKDWARRVMARHEAGDKINPYTLLSARQALGIEGGQAWH